MINRSFYAGQTPDHHTDDTIPGVKDVQGGTVRSGAPGLHGGGDEHSGGCPGVRSAPGHGAQDAGVLGAGGLRACYCN